MSGDVDFDDYVEEEEYEFDILNDRFWRTLAYEEVENPGLQQGDVLYSNFGAMPIAVIQSPKIKQIVNGKAEVGYNTLSYYPKEKTSFIPEWYFLEKLKKFDTGVFPFIIRRHK